MKNNNNINLIESHSEVEYSFKTLDVLPTVLVEYEYLVKKYGYDLSRIDFITGLIYLNMAPMHFGKFSKMLWFEAIKILAKYAS